jgi:ribosomal protein S8
MLMEKTLKIMKQEAYVQGWQDAADSITSKFEEALRGSIENLELPNFGDEDDNKEESQG